MRYLLAIATQAVGLHNTAADTATLYANFSFNEPIYL